MNILMDYITNSLLCKLYLHVIKQQSEMAIAC